MKSHRDRVLWPLQPSGRRFYRVRAREISSKHLGIDLREESVMQTRDYLRHVGFVNHKTDIDLRSALRNHLDGHVGGRAKHTGLDTGGASAISTDQTKHP